MTTHKISPEVIKKAARSLCIVCDENPDHKGDAGGNDYRWQDYLPMVDSVATVLLGAQEPSVFLCNGHIFHSRELAEDHLNSGDRADNAIIPLYTAPQPAPSVPDGWQLVPVEPADEMINTVLNMSTGLSSDDINEIWEILLAAAPNPTSGNPRIHSRG